MAGNTGQQPKPKQKQRGKGRPFAKGVSGNPNGRPRVDDVFRDKARGAADEHCINAWVAEIVAQGPQWIRASELLAAYGFGKPSQRVEHDTTDSKPLSLVINLGD